MENQYNISPYKRATTFLITTFAALSIGAAIVGPLFYRRLEKRGGMQREEAEFSRDMAEDLTNARNSFISN